MTRIHNLAARILVMVLALGVWLAPAAAQPAADAEKALLKTVSDLEARLKARIGIFVSDSASGWTWGHRVDERFLMASTFKSVLCGAVLEQVDRGAVALGHAVTVRGDEVHGHAPTTRERIGQTMRVDELCRATLDLSDNGAANLLVDLLGGPQEVTAFLRRIGDGTTRLDRKEPDLNNFVPGDPRDTTSPSAMVGSWQALLAGNALSVDSRKRLTTWMSHGGVTGPLIRKHLPAGWAISDRSGGGRHHTRNIVAMITPSGKEPYFVAIYLSDTPANWTTRNEAVSALGARVVQLIKAR